MASRNMSFYVFLQTTTLAGYTIPKDTYIIPNLDSVLHSEKTWGDPHTFRPERFIDAQGKLKQVKYSELGVC